MATSVSEIAIHAPLSRVWDVLTNPALVKQWQYGSELTTDWQVGGDIRFRSEWQGSVFEQWGKVMEVVPHSLVKYSLFAPRPGLEDTPENHFVMTYRVHPQGTQTILTIEMLDSRPGASEQESSDDEGQAVLARLKRIAEEA